MIKAVIFDIDGVLVDSFDSNHEFMRQFFTQLNFRPPTKQEYKKLFHLTMFDTIKHVTKISNKKEIDRIGKSAYNIVGYPVHLFKAPKDAQTVIKQLFKKYTLALVTSRMKTGVETYLAFSKLEKYFKTIVHFSHYKNPKPHPEPLLVAIRRLKIKPSEAVYIGDSPTDILAGNAAGIKVILYSKKKLPGAAYYASSFKVLPKLIAKC